MSRNKSCLPSSSLILPPGAIAAWANRLVGWSAAARGRVQHGTAGFGPIWKEFSWSAPLATGRSVGRRHEKQAGRPRQITITIIYSIYIYIYIQDQKPQKDPFLVLAARVRTLRGQSTTSQLRCCGFDGFDSDGGYGMGL